MKLLDKARRAVGTLPSTLEGYSRVKSVLQDLYGKEIEILKTSEKKIWAFIHSSSESKEDARVPWEVHS